MKKNYNYLRSTQAALSALLMGIIFLTTFRVVVAQNYPQPAANIMNYTQRWTDGAHWNPNGSINDAPNAPQEQGIVRCGSSASTQSQIEPVNHFVYNTGLFVIDVT